ncbi:hypothetical protein CB1_000794003 [Camelus ferus]|nr:hypothetical protein CB1_000794003 [Camelus ferus]
MGIKHFSGLFVLLCIGFGLSILTTIETSTPPPGPGQQQLFWSTAITMMALGDSTSNMGPRQLSVWNTSNLSHDNRRKYIFSDDGRQNQLGLWTHQDIPLPPRRRELPASLTTNGRADSLSGARNSVMQELSELEKQIQVIRQELQLAVSRKTELEEYQRTNWTCEP